MVPGAKARLIRMRVMLRLKPQPPTEETIQAYFRMGAMLRLKLQHSTEETIRAYFSML